MNNYHQWNASHFTAVANWPALINNDGNILTILITWYATTCLSNRDRWVHVYVCVCVHLLTVVAADNLSREQCELIGKQTTSSRVEPPWERECKKEENFSRMSSEKILNWLCHRPHLLYWSRLSDIWFQWKFTRELSTCGCEDISWVIWSTMR